MKSVENELLNCWEFDCCRRLPSGAKTSKCEACPCASTIAFNQINNGVSGGRFCWNVKDTLCSGKPDGHPRHKLSRCLSCEFLKYVQNQEGREFKLTTKMANIEDLYSNSSPN